MKVYISLPISGKDIEEVKARCEEAKAEIIKDGHIPLSPLDLVTDYDAPYSEHMGRDIAALLECDAVMFMPGWTRSRGCRLEYQAAKIYDKQRIFFKNILW